MKNQLENMFQFLKDNRVFNRRLQKEVLRPVLCVDSPLQKKVINLLYHTANTQSQPKIDALATFFKSIHQDRRKTQSFGNFVQFLTGKKSCLFNDLYRGLRDQSGWGPKTSALFTKVVYQAHNKFGSDFEFWSDTPRQVSNKDQLWLPVDAVIMHIFQQMGMHQPTFAKINQEIKQHYRGDKLEIWDDLWFWGFITQKGTGQARTSEWNENKYWMLIEASKSPPEIARTKEKARIFLKHLIK